MISPVCWNGLEVDLGVSRVVDPVPAPSRVLPEAHREGVVPRRTGRRVVLVPGSPDATPQSIENRFLVDEGSLTDAVSTGGANLQFRQGGCPVTLQNRFDPLINDADSDPAVSRPEEFAMTEASSTESQELGRPSRRLRLVWNPATQDEEAAPMDSHDQRLERVRRVVQRERNDRRVLAASEFVITAAERIGFVDPGGEIPRQVRQLRWSVFNVPLMWAAAAGEDDCAVLGWMSARAENLPHITINGEHVPASEALRVGWEALRDTFRSWDIRSRKDLAEWMHRQGFIRPRWGAHFSGRIQERTWSGVVARDVRGAVLESFYVHLVLNACSSENRVSPPEAGPQAAAPTIGESQWSSLDEIGLPEVFQTRFRVLQSCGAHLKGRYRSAMKVALEAVHTAVEQRDLLTEVRGWKLFSLLPFWLLRKPLSQGRVGKSELSERFEAFTRGALGRSAFGGDQGRVTEPCSRDIRASDT